MVEITFVEFADETLQNLEREYQQRISSKLDELADFPEHYLARLSGFPGYKLRVGDVHVIVDWDRENDELYVVAILKRKHEYRELSGLREVWGSWREE